MLRGKSVWRTCNYAVVLCISPDDDDDRGHFVYGQNFNSPAFYVVYNTYVMMSYVVFRLPGNGTAKRTFPLPLPSCWWSRLE